MSERDEIDEIIARAMRLQAVEANKILASAGRSNVNRFGVSPA